MKRVRALPPIPEKHFFKIGEVAELLGVKTSVLRFWETEFGQIRPTKTTNGHRVYARSDVEVLRRIHALVHGRGMTIAGARALLQQGENAVSSVLDAQPLEVAHERDVAFARAAQAGAQAQVLVERVALLERSLREAKDEAFFWQRRALSEERRLRELVAQVEPQLRALRKTTESLPSTNSD